jgi:hypothetical protein
MNLWLSASTSKPVYLTAWESAQGDAKLWCMQIRSTDKCFAIKYTRIVRLAMVGTTWLERRTLIVREFLYFTKPHDAGKEIAGIDQASPKISRMPGKSLREERDISIYNLQPE